MKLKEQIIVWAAQEAITYIIYGSQEALVLFDESLEAITKSKCLAFHIAEFSKYKYPQPLLTDAFPIEGYRVIDEYSYHILHDNLCQKIGPLIRMGNIDLYNSTKLHFMNKILFICSGNKQRSKTADDLFSEQYPNLEIRSAGTNIDFCRKIGTTPLSEDMLVWADYIYVMEKKHYNQINNHVGGRYNGKMEVLHIPDKYKYYDKKLITLLKEKVMFSI